MPKRRTIPRVERNCIECGAAFTVLLERCREKRPGHGMTCSIPCNNANLRRKKSQKIRDSFEERFWARVSRRGPEECWPWTGSTDKNGYGFVSRGNRNHRATRIAYSLVRGEIADGLHMCHHCDNPTCCNPAHLYAGTHQENMKDRMLRKLPIAERIKLKAG